MVGCEFKSANTVNAHVYKNLDFRGTGSSSSYLPGA